TAASRRSSARGSPVLSRQFHRAPSHRERASAWIVSWEKPFRELKQVLLFAAAPLRMTAERPRGLLHVLVEHVGEGAPAFAKDIHAIAARPPLNAALAH